jgi:hypothetical protein
MVVLIVDLTIVLALGGLVIVLRLQAGRLWLVAVAMAAAILL